MLSGTKSLTEVSWERLNHMELSSSEEVWKEHCVSYLSAQIRVYWCAFRRLSIHLDFRLSAGAIIYFMENILKPFRERWVHQINKLAKELSSALVRQFLWDHSKSHMLSRRNMVIKTRLLITNGIMAYWSKPFFDLSTLSGTVKGTVESTDY